MPVATTRFDMATLSRTITFFLIQVISVVACLCFCIEFYQVKMLHHKTCSTSMHQPTDIGIEILARMGRMRNFRHRIQEPTVFCFIGFANDVMVLVNTVP